MRRSSKSTAFERWSRRWRWPERKAKILAGRARVHADLAEYEQIHDLPAAEDAGEIDRRWWASFREVSSHRIGDELKQALKGLREA